MRRFLRFNMVIYILTIGILLNIIYIGTLAFYPFKTVVIKNNPFPVLNNPIKAGRPVLYKADYCRYTNIPAHLTITLVGESVITLPDTTVKALSGCHKVKAANVVVPLYTSPGIYHADITSCIQVTSLQYKCVNYKTQNFKVIQ